MSEINWRRVVLGGLLAGVVLFVCSAVVNALMSEALQLALRVGMVVRSRNAMALASA